MESGVLSDSGFFNCIHSWDFDIVSDMDYGANVILCFRKKIVKYFVI